MIKKIYNAAFTSHLVKNLSSKNVFLLTWVILHHSPMMTRANGSLNPDASEPIRDRAWYMCALTWKNWKGRIKHKRYENIFFSAQLKVRFIKSWFLLYLKILWIFMEFEFFRVFTTKIHNITAHWMLVLIDFCPV